MGSFERWLMRAAPNWLRNRLVLRLGNRLVRASYRSGRLVYRLRKGAGTVDLRASVFCDVREPVGHPLCGFYRSALARLFALFNVPAKIEITSCRAAGGGDCAMTVRIEQD